MRENIAIDQYNERKEEEIVLYDERYEVFCE